MSYATAGAIVGLAVPRKSEDLAGETSSDEGLADGVDSEFLGDNYWSSIVYGEVHCGYVGGCRKRFRVVTRSGRSHQAEAASEVEVETCRERRRGVFWGIITGGGQK